ncbi:hypothetical protein P168DRAFT_31624 [Aspergillus campestris IBT 28561]|uniref:Uncharacterized protein n=1 Tax=Aspergillus campestris (strain IBT 28561) TaxID=1392248 RepID=A0A2I1DGX9_ASPC2|nr:uncharacterized protein P168DRAFT_31624 [Aspergillus campestris IBT 28561]PKY09132.1 hypothetical protein P168DRAFT_31624 [Aspergillus campestris IBT 28561]
MGAGRSCPRRPKGENIPPCILRRPSNDNSKPILGMNHPPIPLSTLTWVSDRHHIEEGTVETLSISCCWIINRFQTAFRFCVAFTDCPNQPVACLGCPRIPRLALVLTLLFDVDGPRVDVRWTISQAHNPISWKSMFDPCMWISDLGKRQ